MTKARQLRKNQTLRIRHDLMQQDLVNEAAKAVIVQVGERLQNAIEQQFEESRQRFMTEEGGRYANHRMRLQILDRALYRQKRQLEQAEEIRQREKMRHNRRLQAIEKRTTVQSWVLGAMAILLGLTIVLMVGW